MDHSQTSKLKSHSKQTQNLRVLFYTLGQRWRLERSPKMSKSPSSVPLPYCERHKMWLLHNASAYLEDRTPCVLVITVLTAVVRSARLSSAALWNNSSDLLLEYEKSYYSHERRKLNDLDVDIISLEKQSSKHEQVKLLLTSLTESLKLNCRLIIDPADHTTLGTVNKDYFKVTTSSLNCDSLFINALPLRQWRLADEELAVLEETVVSQGAGKYPSLWGSQTPRRLAFSSAMVSLRSLWTSD